MGDPRETMVREICRAHDLDRTRLLDIAREVLRGFGCVSEPSRRAIGRELRIPEAGPALGMVIRNRLPRRVAGHLGKPHLTPCAPQGGHQDTK